MERNVFTVAKSKMTGANECIFVEAEVLKDLMMRRKIKFDSG